MSHIRHVYLMEGIFGTLAAVWVPSRFAIPGVFAAFALACLLFSFRAKVFQWWRGQEE